MGKKTGQIAKNPKTVDFEKALKSAKEKLDQNPLLPCAEVSNGIILERIKETFGIPPKNENGIYGGYSVKAVTPRIQSYVPKKFNKN